MVRWLNKAYQHKPPVKNPTIGNKGGIKGWDTLEGLQGSRLEGLSQFVKNIGGMRYL